MRANSPPNHVLSTPLERAILVALVKIAPPLQNSTLPPSESWPSTRKISDANDISIYKARLLLLDLARRGLVIVSERGIGNSLRWYPHKDFMLARKLFSSQGAKEERAS
ncbi:hypothetical protein I5P78_25925 [Serratia marcescens]|nr:hypothetical protein [Serratia marcescens]